MNDLISWLGTWYSGGGFTVKLAGALAIILCAFIADKLFCRVMGRIMKDSVEVGENNRRVTPRRVIRSVAHYVISFIALMMVLSVFGVNVVSILAAAGVLGLAVSFGAQSLIKDIFAGFFIIYEDQYGVGEYITVNNSFTGVVELIELRTTRLRGDDGELIIIPNGSITDIVNYCRGSLRIKEVFEISFDSDIDEAEAVLTAAAKEYYETHRDVLFGEPFVEGVEIIGESGVAISLFAYVQPMEKWRVGRELRKLIVQSLRRAGITIPYPVRELITKEEEHGSGYEG